MRLPTPGMSSSGNLNNGAGISLGCQIVTPFGLSTLHAIFASNRLAANPMEQVIPLSGFVFAHSRHRRNFASARKQAQKIHSVGSGFR